MKILFLDFDGVMNSDRWLFLVTGEEKWHDLCPEMVQRVKRIVDVTDCKIVISSAWRQHYPLDELIYFLEKAGWKDPPVFDITPSFTEYHKNRGHEIKAWLYNTEENIESYAILDDNQKWIGDDLEDHFVLTNVKKGITDEDAQKVIEILNRPKS